MRISALRPATSAGCSPSPHVLPGSPQAQEPLQGRPFPQPARPSECGESMNSVCGEAAGREGGPGWGGAPGCVARKGRSQNKKAVACGVRSSDCSPGFHKSRQGTTTAESASYHWSLASLALCLKASETLLQMQWPQQATLHVVVAVTDTAIQRGHCGLQEMRGLRKSVISKG